MERNFEVRVAKKRIFEASPESTVGVEGRRVPSDVVSRYIGVVQLGTKTLEDIMWCDWTG